MSNNETDELAFPSSNQVRVGEWVSEGHPGMSLRDYFAAKALQGMIAAGMLGSFSPSPLAFNAYGLADAMLEARKQ